MALTFGLALMNDFPPGAPLEDRMAQLREQARLAGRSGIDSVWVLHHYLGTMPTFQPLLLLSALAADTGDMRLGTNMYILPLRHPVGVAEEFATLDRISGGRVIAGLGMGYRENEFQAFGVPMEQRVERYTEAVDIVRRLWTAEPVTYMGRHFRLSEATISMPPAQPGGPPIWVGAGAHRAGIERAARWGDAWIVPPHVTGDRLADALARYREARERLHPGAPVELVVRRELLLDADREAAWQAGLAARSALTGEYARHNAPDTTADYAHLQSPDAAERTARYAYLFTDPAGAIAELKELERAGVTRVVLRMQWFDLPQDRVLESLDLFRREVAPHFR